MMMKWILTQALVFTVLFACCVVGDDDADDATADTSAAVQLFPSGNDLFSNAMLVDTVYSVMLSPCSDVVSWDVVYSGMTKETSPGVFKCINGEANCAYLETMNCVKKNGNYTTPQLLEIGIFGRGGYIFILEQLSEEIRTAVHKCTTSGEGAKLLHAATVYTKKTVEFDDDDEESDVALTINGRQKDNDEIWVDFVLQNTLCGITKDKRCCPPPPTPQTTTSTKVSKQLQQRQQHDDDGGIILKSSFRGIPSSSLPSPPPLTDKKNVISLYSNGNAYINTQLLLRKIAPMMYSTCGDMLRWKWIFAGRTTETSPGVFKCLGGQDNCYFLETMGCLAEEALTGAGPQSYERDLLMFSILGRPGGVFMEELFVDSVAKKLQKCMRSGDGKTILHDMISTTSHHIKWDTHHRDELGLTINGRQPDESLITMDLFKEVCKATKLEQCCR